MRNILVFLGALAVVLITGVGLYQWLGTPGSGPAAVSPAAKATATVTIDPAKAAKVRADDLVMGNKDAPVTIIEYSSLTCPHCQNFHINVLPALKKLYIDTGKLRLVYRDFPLDGAALRASMLARCAGQDRAVALIDILFRRQSNWAGSQDPVAALARIGALVGIDTAGFNKCLGDQDLQRKILEQRLEGERAFGINGTPSFIVEGRKTPLALDIKAFSAVIDPLLGKK